MNRRMYARWARQLSTPTPLRLGLFVEQPMSWTFLFQVASTCNKTKHNIRERKKICPRGECQKEMTGTLSIGFDGLYSWPDMLLTAKSGVLSSLVGARVWSLWSVRLWLPRSAFCRACGLNILANCDQQRLRSVRLHVSINIYGLAVKAGV